MEEMVGMLPDEGMVGRIMRALGVVGERVAMLVGKMGMVVRKVKEKTERVRQLETECESLKAAAEGLMQRLETGASSESELRHASSLISAQQNKIAQLEKMLSDATIAAMNPSQVSPPRTITPHPLPPPTPFVEVEVIGHHTKIIETPLSEYQSCSQHGGQSRLHSQSVDCGYPVYCSSTIGQGYPLYNGMVMP
eukprot:TRINITY_DN31242_c0_g1_i1.p1 TRINITY_DN31242_c0_g1~~TRINITY_DN31242_c0_g1_i1.p1  ORF type:complete len:202 (+),score=56.39 TRINITY_DN31242_c0_g1_i1:25-606(+)